MLISEPFMFQQPRLTLMTNSIPRSTKLISKDILADDRLNKVCVHNMRFQDAPMQREPKRTREREERRNERERERREGEKEAKRERA